MVDRLDSGWVEVEHVQPVFDRLIAIYGTKAKVAAALGIPKQGFLHPDKKRIQRKTLNRALDLLMEHESTDEYSNSNLPLLVVSVELLSIELRKWADAFTQNHKIFYENNQMGPMQLLSDLTGKSLRVVGSYVNNTRQDKHNLWVDVNVADQLLTAIDLNHLLSNGTIPVIPNPKLTMEAWVKRMEQRGCI